MNQLQMETEQPAIVSPAGAALSVPAKFLRFLGRVVHLKPGRYTITLSVYGDRCDWSFSDPSKIEH